MTLTENEWFIQAPWGKLSVVAWGNCQPPVLLVHDLLDTAATFRPLVSQLPENFYYIAIELPGNGKSDPYPPGMMISIYDLVYCVILVVRHYRWKKFTYIGHSTGAIIGLIYQLSYPGKVDKFIELDPSMRATTVPASEYAAWYKYSFTEYYENYEKFNAPKETAPKHTVEQAVKVLMELRGLSRVAAEASVQRMTERLPDGFVRFTFDPRYKRVTFRPYSPQDLETTCTNMKTPTLVVAARDSINNKVYEHCDFVFDQASFPAKKYRVRIVDGMRDVHFVAPELVAPYISQFLVYGLEGINENAKL
ncbi:LOW QUALITY PROTEIN: serine hydrolase-like protein 2 [Aphomia sociella]